MGAAGTGALIGVSICSPSYQEDGASSLGKVLKQRATFCLM